MKYLLDYSVSELKDILKEEMGEKPFRAGQIYEWLTKCTPFAEMTNLSLALRKKLSENFSEGYPKMLARQVSSDGTRAGAVWRACSCGMNTETAYVSLRRWDAEWTAPSAPPARADL